MKIFSRKDRKIANLETKIKNRDRLIDDLSSTNAIFRAIINSLEEDNRALREHNFIQYKNELSQTANQQ